MSDKDLTLTGNQETGARLVVTKQHSVLARPIQRIIGLLQERLPIIFSGYDSSRRKAMQDLAGGAAQLVGVVKPGPSIVESSTSSLKAYQTIPGSPDELMLVLRASYNQYRKNAMNLSITNAGKFEELRTELSRYTNILYEEETPTIDGKSIDALNDETLVASVDWDNLPVLTMNDEALELFIPYAPTKYLPKLLNQHSGIIPDILAETFHVHEELDIQPYLQTFFSKNPEKLSNCYCNPQIVIHYPSNALFYVSIQHIENTQRNIFVFDIMEGGNEAFKSLIEMSCSHTSCIDDTLQLQASNLLLRRLLELFPTSPDSFDPLNRLSCTAKRMLFLKNYGRIMSNFENYYEGRKGSGNLHMPQIKDAFIDFLGTDKSISPENQKILDFLESIS